MPVTLQCERRDVREKNGLVHGSLIAASWGQSTSGKDFGRHLRLVAELTKQRMGLPFSLSYQGTCLRRSAQWSNQLQTSYCSSGQRCAFQQFFAVRQSVLCWCRICRDLFGDLRRRENTATLGHNALYQSNHHHWLRGGGPGSARIRCGVLLVDKWDAHTSYDDRSWVSNIVCAACRPGRVDWMAASLADLDKHGCIPFLY